jgi:hypothetical protein
MASMAVLVVSLRVNQQSIARETKARQASEQAFCGILILLDDTYRKTPPSTPAGKGLARAIAVARQQYHCPPRA